MDKTHFKTIDDYIASFPDDVQPVLETLRQTIHEAAPTAEEKISYNMPTFVVGERALIHFAGWKEHISLYPVSTAMERSLEELNDYKTSGKGTIQFPLDQPLPLPLIKKIIVFRLQEGHAEV